MSAVRWLFVTIAQSDRDLCTTLEISGRYMLSDLHELSFMLRPGVRLSVVMHLDDESKIRWEWQSPAVEKRTRRARARHAIEAKQ